MSYIINNFNGSYLTTINDGSLDNTTDLTLVGSNYSGFGTIQNDNFLFLLENFASPSSPTKPIAGQLWYDTATNKLKLYASTKTWRGISGADTSPNFPTNLSEGEFWFDTAHNELYIYSLSAGNNSTPGFILIGPPIIDPNTTKMDFVSVIDTSGASHQIIKATSNSSVVFVVSNDEDFELNNSINSIVGFKTIKSGVTLCNTQNDTQPGLTTSLHRFWGTASTSEKMVVADAPQDKICAATIDIPSGDDKTSIVVRDSLGNISGASSKADSLKVHDSYLIGDTEVNPNTIVARDNDANIKANQFIGVSDNANKLKLDSSYVSAESGSAAASTIVARDALGDIKVNVMHGTATSAQYADLAEKYLADADYDIGTVVMVGGELEITAAILEYRPIGVISGCPGFMLNENLENGQYVALKGRVPVKVHGFVKKGDKLTSSIVTGVAIVGDNSNTFAIALETNDQLGVRTIEAVIL